MKYPCLALFLVFTLTINAQKKEELRFYTLKDSSYTRWSGMPNSSCDPSWEKYMVDASGNLFKLPTKYGNMNRPMKLTSDGWITWDKGLGPESISSLETDGRGLIFASSREHLYLLQDSAWKEMPTAGSGYPPIPFPDGGLYRFGDENGGSNTYKAERKQIMRWSESGYKPCGANGTPLFTQHKTDRFIVDRQGRIYSYQDNVYGTPQIPVEVYTYTDGNWKSIGTLPADIIFWGFDMNNNLYVNGWDDAYVSYFKKWDGHSWVDIPSPQNVELKSGILFDESLNIYIEGEDDAAKQSVLYRHKDGEWKEVARSDKGNLVDKFIPTTTDIYAIMKEGQTVQKYSGRWIVRQMEIANIPVNPAVNANPGFTGRESDATRLKLFRQDGKLGIQDIQGYIWVYPVFDYISIEKTPAHMTFVQKDEELIRGESFCVRMIAGSDTVFIPTDAFRYGSPEPGELNGFRRKISRSCSTCNGKGTVEAKEEKVKVRGEYVGGSTSYSTSGENTWYPSCNCYVYTTKVVTETTHGGYYKEKYETVRTPGGTCPACEGKGTYYSYERYVFKGGKYTRVWE